MKIKTLIPKTDNDMKQVMDVFWNEIKEKKIDITKETFLDIMALLTNIQNNLTAEYMVLFENIPRTILKKLAIYEMGVSEELLRYCTYNLYINLVSNQLEFIRKKFPNDFETIYNNIKRVVEEWK